MTEADEPQSARRASGQAAPEPAPATPAPVARHGRLPRRRAITGILGTLGIAFAVMIVSTLSIGSVWAWQTLDQLTGDSVVINPTPAVPPTIGAYEGGFNVLLVGSDADEDRDGARNDVTILVHVSADQTNAVAVSLPRDLLVPFPECTRPDGTTSFASSSRMINESLAEGGLACSVNVVEELTGLDIQFAGEISFQGVIAMSDAVGGVPVCFAGDFYDRYTGLRLSEGTNVLEGNRAMLFLRSRHGVGDGGDLTRISSQQVYLSSLMRKVKSEGTLTDPAKLFSLANAASANMTLSDELSSLDTMVAMARALATVDLAQMVFVQYPTFPAGNRVVPDQSKADELMAAIAADERFTLSDIGDGRGSVADPSATPTDTAAPEPTESAPVEGETDAPEPTETAAPPADAPVFDIPGQTAADQTCTVPNR